MSVDNSNRLTNKNLELFLNRYLFNGTNTLLNTNIYDIPQNTRQDNKLSHLAIIQIFIKYIFNLPTNSPDFIYDAYLKADYFVNDCKLYVYDLYQIRNEYNKSSLSDKAICKALLLKYSDNGNMINKFINTNIVQVLDVINNSRLKSKVYRLLNKSSNDTIYSNHVYILYLTIISIYLLGLLYNEVLGNKYDYKINPSYKYTISIPQVNKLFNLGYTYTKSNIDNKLYSNVYKPKLVEKIKYVLFMFIKQVSIKKASIKKRKNVIPSFDNSIDYLVKYTNLIGYTNIGDITIKKNKVIKDIKPILNNIIKYILKLLNYQTYDNEFIKKIESNKKNKINLYITYIINNSKTLIYYVLLLLMPYNQDITNRFKHYIYSKQRKLIVNLTKYNKTIISFTTTIYTFVKFVIYLLTYGIKITFENSGNKHIIKLTKFILHIYYYLLLYLNYYKSGSEYGTNTINRELPDSIETTITIFNKSRSILKKIPVINYDNETKAYKFIKDTTVISHIDTLYNNFDKSIIIRNNINKYGIEIIGFLFNFKNIIIYESQITPFFNVLLNLLFGDNVININLFNLTQLTEHIKYLRIFTHTTTSQSNKPINTNNNYIRNNQPRNLETLIAKAIINNEIRKSASEVTHVKSSTILGLRNNTIPEAYDNAIYTEYFIPNYFINNIEYMIPEYTLTLRQSILSNPKSNKKKSNWIIDAELHNALVLYFFRGSKYGPNYKYHLSILQEITNAFNSPSNEASSLAIYSTHKKLLIRFNKFMDAFINIIDALISKLSELKQKTTSSSSNNDEGIKKRITVLETGLHKSMMFFFEILRVIVCKFIYAPLCNSFNNIPIKHDYNNINIKNKNFNTGKFTHYLESLSRINTILGYISYKPCFEFTEITTVIPTITISNANNDIPRPRPVEPVKPEPKPRNTILVGKLKLLFTDYTRLPKLTKHLHAGRPFQYSSYKFWQLFTKDDFNKLKKNQYIINILDIIKRGVNKNITNANSPRPKIVIQTAIKNNLTNNNNYASATNEAKYLATESMNISNYEFRTEEPNIQNTFGFKLKNELDTNLREMRLPIKFVNHVDRYFKQYMSRENRGKFLVLLFKYYLNYIDSTKHKNIPELDNKIDSYLIWDGDKEYRKIYFPNLENYFYKLSYTKAKENKIYKRNI